MTTPEGDAVTPQIPNTDDVTETPDVEKVEPTSRFGRRRKGRVAVGTVGATAGAVGATAGAVEATAEPVGPTAGTVGTVGTVGTKVGPAGTATPASETAGTVGASPVGASPVGASPVGAGTIGAGTIGKVEESAKSGTPKVRPNRFAGTAAFTGTPTPGGAAAPGTADAPPGTPKHKISEDKTPKTSASAVRHRRVSGRMVILVVVALLVIGAAGAWYYKKSQSSPTTPGATPDLADLAVAARVGVQTSDLPGWTKTASQGDAFAPKTVNSAAAVAAGTKASATLAQCLKVPTADVGDAFDASSVGRSATASSPTFNDPAAAGTTVSSVASVMGSAATVTQDAAVLSNRALFVSCYEPYAQAMLPYVPTANGAPFTSVTVQPAIAPGSASSSVTDAGYVITRTGTGGSVVTTAVAVLGGRVETTLALTSTTAFPTTPENTLVAAVEGRVAANLSA